MKLLEFLADLATDAELMSAFRRAPATVLRTRNLSEQDQHLLLSGDPIALRAALAAATARTAHSAGLQTGSAMLEEFPRPDEPEEPEEPEEAFPAPAMFEEFPRPDEPEQPEEPEPEVAFPAPAMLEEFPRPDEPEEPEEPEEIVAAEAESLQPEPLDVEPFDVDLDLAQDAVLVGLKAGRAACNDPAGVWSGKGLTIVGMGMRAGLHMTVETRLAIEQSARVLYLVGDPVSEICIRRLNSDAASLGHLYRVGTPRIEIYESIIARIMAELETHGDVCVAFYGHPGVLTYPAWESIRRARATGKRARMLPAISTEDSLFADLGIDIGRAGLQSFEATRFLYYQYNFDACAGLLLWQVSVLGENEWNPPHTGARPRLQVLADYLQKFYAPEHDVFLYHAPEYPTSRPLVERLQLRDLPKAEFVSLSTLYVPPAGKPQRNEENIRALARATARK